MIRPMSEIEYPPSEALCMKARMLARMEALSTSTDALMNVIASRLNAEEMANQQEVETLTVEQQELIENMRRLVSK